jgi:hypothetical protein
MHDIRFSINLKMLFLSKNVLALMKWLKERKKAIDLSWLEVWILLVLKAAGGRWVGVDKIMAIIFLLERVYGLSRACFVPGRIPWSEDVANALKRFVSLRLVEELPQGGAYRLTEKGRMAVEKYSLSDVKIRYPFSCIKFFIDWDTDTLAEYIQVNYPDWKA